MTKNHPWKFEKEVVSERGQIRKDVRWQLDLHKMDFCVVTADGELQPAAIRLKVSGGILRS